MIRKYQVVNLVMIVGFVLGGLFAGIGQKVSAAKEVYSEAPNATPVTIITVDSGTDPDTNNSYTCLTQTPCTLRRAVVQARNLSAAQKPVLIQFAIPESAAEGYDSTLDIWTIEFSGISSIADAAVRQLNGGIIIDGDTQPGGRSDGPKIILVASDTDDTGIKLGEYAAQNSNEIYGLGFQNFRTHIVINSSNNIIEDNWFGLSDDGSEPYLRNGNPQDGSGDGGINVTSGANNNLIQNNVFLGFDGNAITVRGEQNSVANNYIGTTADGSIPDKETDPDLICSNADWLGGGGISIEGTIYSGVNHVIEGNIIAGLRQQIFTISTQPTAIHVLGRYHLIQNNQIGVDKTGAKVGICGRGIYLSEPSGIQVLNNTIAYPGMSALSLNGALYAFHDGNLLRSNIILSKEWLEVEGNATPEDAIQLGKGLPDPFELFKPAKITNIDGTTVKGTSGDGSDCPDCVIEIFLDDTNLVTETLQSLAVVTANTNGEWTATLPFELSSDQGLRTTSTSAKQNTIPNIAAGTTTGLSELYVSGGSIGDGKTIFLPLLIK